MSRPLKNLAIETLEALAESGKSAADVFWVGSYDGKRAVSFAQFLLLAKAAGEYDAGFGSQHVCSDLVVVGADWWLERREYDGSEWWCFQSQPRRASYPVGVRQVMIRPCGDADADWDRVR